jgi:hypothetical protein
MFICLNIIIKSVIFIADAKFAAAFFKPPDIDASERRLG